MRLRELSALVLLLAAPFGVTAAMAGETAREATAKASTANGPVDLSGAPRDPFASPARARVFLFLRADCPIGNRYAPELQRLAKEFSGQRVEFWLIYPDPAETASAIRDHVSQYHFPGEPLRDPQFQLVKRARATIAPEAAVFDSNGRLMYRGRIDDRWVDVGRARPSAETHDLENAISAVLAGKPVPAAETRAVGCFLSDLQ
jgi:hypothetical protein